MEITKELKKKMLTANSAEEVGALLGDQATEEEKDRIWHEIKKTGAADDLVTVDDDELEAVSGGIWGYAPPAADGFESSCIVSFHWKNECEKSLDPNGYHFYVRQESRVVYKCQYCEDLLDYCTTEF